MYNPREVVVYKKGSESALPFSFMAILLFISIITIVKLTNNKKNE